MTIYYEGLVTCVNCGPCDYFSVGNSYELKQRNCDGVYFITDDNGINHEVFRGSKVVLAKSSTFHYGN